MDAFLGKFSGEVRKDLGETHGVLWERDADVENCRSCKSKFSVRIRRHHCRGCGGIFCETCSVANATMENEKVSRACNGCLTGKTPGISIKEMAEKSVRGKFDDSRKPAEEITIQRESKYPLNSSTSSSSPPQVGYFEFYNKSEFVICIKIFSGGEDFFWEVPRPTYTVVPPLSTIHAEFDPTCKNLQFVLLVNNPSLSRSGGGGGPGPIGLIEETRHLEDIPPHLRVDNFKHFIVYQVASFNCNILLKYKGDGTVELRKGTSVSRLGLFGYLGLSSSQSNGIDFSTNSTERITVLCTVSSISPPPALSFFSNIFTLLFYGSHNSSNFFFISCFSLS